MEKLEYIVPETEAGTRLDLFLSVISGLSRSHCQKLCREGYVLLDGKIVSKPGERLKGKEELQLYVPPPEPMEAKPEQISLDIVFEDDHLLVVNKPKGMVVHPAAGHRKGTLVNALLGHCKDLQGMKEKIRPGIVHRLDKDTSGLLVVAKNDFTYRALAQQMKERKIEREYVALVHGFPPALQGTVELPIGRSARDRKKFAVVEEGKGRRAVTHYRLLKKIGSAFALLSLELETGRTHQIRVHMAHLGCPVVGDPLYGPARSPYRNRGQLLHARRLSFTHPVTGENLDLRVEPGEETGAFLGRGEVYDSD